jgi:hypothetical protein
MPSLHWEENLCDEDARVMTTRIIETLTGALGPRMAGSRRLFFVVPTPSPYARAEAELLAAARSAGIGENALLVLDLPRAGRCYTVGSEDGLRRLIPAAFRLGPSELTFIVADGELDLGAPREQLTALVLAVLTDRPLGDRTRAAGLHFDSGEPVESF